MLSVTPASPVLAGTASTLTATTSWSAPGSVRFVDNGTNVGSEVPVAAFGVASVTTTLSPGTHTLGAVFNGQCPISPEPNVVYGCLLYGTTSSASPVTYVVNAPMPTPAARATTTTLRVFPSRAVEGLPTIFLANVAPFGAAGMVRFMDGTTALGVPVPVTAGFALTVTTLPKGTHSLTAVFTPTDPTAYAESTSSPVPLTVGASLGRVILR